jgi:hypothetical protein
MGNFGEFEASASEASASEASASCVLEKLPRSGFWHLDCLWWFGWYFGCFLEILFEFGEEMWIFEKWLFFVCFCKSAKHTWLGIPPDGAILNIKIFSFLHFVEEITLHGKGGKGGFVFF